MSFSIPTLKPYRLRSSGCSYSITSNPDTLLLMHGEDLNDYTSNNWSVTNSNITIASSPSKFCNNFLFNGSSSYMQLPNDVAFNLNIFTVEMWIYLNSTPLSNMCIMAPYSGQGFAWFIGTDLKMYISNNVTGSAGASTALTTGEWHHIVGVYNGYDLDDPYMYTLQDGETGGSTSSAIIGSLQAQHRIGLPDNVISSAYLDANVDELRISNSVVYAHGSYTVPTGPFA